MVMLTRVLVFADAYGSIGITEHTISAANAVITNARRLGHPHGRRRIGGAAFQRNTHNTRNARE